MTAKRLGQLLLAAIGAAPWAAHLYGCCNPVTQTGLTQSMIANPAPTGSGGASVAYHGTLADAKDSADIGGGAVSRHHLLAAADTQLGRWFRLQGIYRAGLWQGATERPGGGFGGPPLPRSAAHLLLFGGEAQFLHGDDESLDFGLRVHLGPSVSKVATSAGTTETTVTPAFDAGLFVRHRPLEKLTFDYAAGFMSPGVRVTGLDASFNDDTIVALTRGATVSVTQARLDFGRVLTECRAGLSGSSLCNFCQDIESSTYSEDLCDGTTLREHTAFRTVSDFDPFEVEPSPLLAKLLQTTTQIGEHLQRAFAAPLPADARYIATSARVEGDEGVAELEYIRDRDGDLVDDQVDNCPLTPNADQANADGDGYGDACDLCPGVRNDRETGETEAREFGDWDGDGRPNGCDCDADGDGCVEPGQEYGAGGPPTVVECVPGDGETFDGQTGPFLSGEPGSEDFDGDGIANQCDADLDGDGVANEVDNCPVGDGEDGFVAGVDDDPDQRDSGGIPAGDLCDPLCHGPDSPPAACGRPGEGSEGGAGAPPPGHLGIYFRGVPGARDCVGMLCTVGALTDCFDASADGCGSFASQLRLTVAYGFAEATLSRDALGLEGGFVRAVAETARDLDGDGLGELIVASPQGTPCADVVCPPFTDCVPSCRQGAGELVVLRSTGSVLARLGGDAAGDAFGSAFAVAGDVLAVGAPGAQGPAGSLDGAVYLFDLSQATPTLIEVVAGDEGDRLGSHLLVYDAQWPPVLIAGAPGAAGGDGALVALRVGEGALMRIPSVEPGAAMSRAAWLPQAKATSLLAASSPSARGGAGVVQIFELSGARVALVVGEPGAELGASLASVIVGSEPLLAIGAPGSHQQAGAVRLVDASGAQRAEYRDWGSQVGRFLTAPGDVDGDGLGDLWVGQVMEGEARTATWSLEP